ncbi:polymorphic toxin type 15 domain-containing protein [uncultured Streptococcus sp.]|uniref:polymorphic toxin type 15 domain-containing protein n=1 Tax=uncultured Streptococcus sp. TaxID=83427 RepID=UPI0026594FB2|nr:polymorphic toxin type 15 domain-containing protein [uncultured Streptococcus sp.]
MARVGTRGAGLSKDIALSVRNKLTHLGANVSDDLARLSGKVEDAFAYADGAVSKNIGKHNARVYQSNGGNWDEVASGILGGSGAGRKAAAEFSDDASQALAKHGDEVSQALRETGEQAGKHASAEFGGEASEALAKHGDDVARNAAETGKRAANNFADDIGEEIPRLDEVSVEFKYKDKFDETEFSRQLKGQQDGLNNLTVQEYFDNRERYLTEGRSKEGFKAQKKVRKEAFDDKVLELLEEGKSPSQAKAEAREWIKERAALHDPDQIAGGDPTRVTGVGDRRINSSLGAQWKWNIDDMDAQIRKFAEGKSPEELKSTFLNIRLTY